MRSFLRHLAVLERQLVGLGLELVGKPQAHRGYTEAELAILRRDYARTETSQIARALGRSPSSVYQTSYKMGLRKDPAFVVETNRKLGAALARHPKALVNQFKPGDGRGGIKTEAALRAFVEGGKKSRFKKGGYPPNTMPVGSTRWSDGYLYKKVSEDRRPMRLNWEMVHILLWREHKGEIPKGFNVQFKNRDRTDIRIDNLELLSKRENMQRNTYHNWPEPLQDLVHAKAVLTRAINTKKKETEDEND